MNRFNRCPKKKSINVIIRLSRPFRKFLFLGVHFQLNIDLFEDFNIFFRTKKQRHCKTRSYSATPPYLSILKFYPNSIEIVSKSVTGLIRWFKTDTSDVVYSYWLINATSLKKWDWSQKIDETSLKIKDGPQKISWSML